MILSTYRCYHILYVTGADPSSHGRTGHRCLSYKEELKHMPVSKEIHVPRETRSCVLVFSCRCCLLLLFLTFSVCLAATLCTAPPTKCSGIIVSTRNMRREASNADRSHKDRSPATIRSESWEPLHDSRPLQRETGAADTSAAAGLEEGELITTGATAAHVIGKLGIRHRVAPVAAVVYVEGDPNAPLASIPGREGAGIATTTNGAGEPGSPHATVCVI